MKISKMDVLVRWTNGRRNVVSTQDLIALNNAKTIKKGSKVKMIYNKKNYYGVVEDCEYPCQSDSIILDEEENDILEDIIPLSKIKETFAEKKMCVREEQDLISNSDNSSALFSGDDEDDSSRDPNFFQICEVKKCRNFGTKSCFCKLLVCAEHFQDNCNHQLTHSDSDSSYTESKTDNSKYKSKKRKRRVKKDKPNALKSDKNGIKPEEINPERENHCESKNCTDNVFAACVKCLSLLCFKHFDEDDICSNHSQSIMYEAEDVRSTSNGQQRNLIPEDFSMEGSLREETQIKKKKENQRNVKKIQRNSGQGYVQNASLNLVPPKTMRERCKGEACKKQNKKCPNFSDLDRKLIFDAYYGLQNLSLQREYIARYAKKEKKKRCVTESEESRRSNTIHYSLPLQGSVVAVCKVFFINTLAVSEKTVRTTLDKVHESGILEPEKRGGRHKSMVDKDTQLRELIVNHINKFPRVESHYVRSHTSKEYLHEDLNLTRMYHMFCLENPGRKIGSVITYAKIFKEMNLSFHRPKKDKCTLCITYREGDNSMKEKLEVKYSKHIEEKKRVREIKDVCTKISEKDNTMNVAAVFDLQQVIYLPRTNENAIFYKRRLAAYNFTVYNLVSKDCYCYTWHEGISRRGSAEISTCVYEFLKVYAERGVKIGHLFSDGTVSQNKNTIVVAMLLYAVNNLGYQDLSLRFFETNHGQNEGDSAHSAVGYAVSHAGDLFLPSQLIPVIKLARTSKPYHVKQMNFNEFINFKQLSQDLNILKVRQDNESDTPINWNHMVEVRVKSSHPRIIFFKTSHLEERYRSITLKRAVPDPLKQSIRPLNKEPNKLATDKYKDLVSMTEGELPIIRDPEFVKFYQSLPH